MTLTEFFQKAVSGGNTQKKMYHTTVERVFFPKTSVAIVILFWLKWAGYLAVAGLNLLAQLSDRISQAVFFNTGRRKN